MKAFLNADFILQTATAQQLYHDFAADMPIIDYHNHLVPQQIAEDKQAMQLMFGILIYHI
jgi:glucuronate isomerase